MAGMSLALAQSKLRRFPSRMFTKGSVVPKTALDREIASAEARHRSFLFHLRQLIIMLRLHHEALVKLSDAQLETNKVLHDLATDTPLSKFIIGANNNDVESNNTYSKKPSNDSTSNLKVMVPVPTIKIVSKNEDSALVTARRSFGGFDSAIMKVESVQGIDGSLNAILKATGDINKVYAEKFKTDILGYIVQWEKITTTRIKKKSSEFHEKRKNYVKYADKVQLLREIVDKERAKSREVPPVASPANAAKLERNLVKLSVCEREHNDCGRSLLNYVEEVTTMYWKDLLPLLYMILKFSINQSSDVATVMRNLEETYSFLRYLGDRYGVSVAGRLEDLNSDIYERISNPEEVKEVVPRIVGPPSYPPPPPPSSNPPPRNNPQPQHVAAPTVEVQRGETPKEESKPDWLQI